MRLKRKSRPLFQRVKPQRVPGPDDQLKINSKLLFCLFSLLSTLVFAYSTLGFTWKYLAFDTDPHHETRLVLSPPSFLSTRHERVLTWRGVVRVSKNKSRRIGNLTMTLPTSHYRATERPTHFPARSFGVSLSLSLLLLGMHIRDIPPTARIFSSLPFCFCF